MNYPNIAEVEPCFKKYLLDSLEERERIEKALLYSLQDIFIRSAERIISQLLKEHGLKSIQNTKKTLLKPLSSSLESFIDRDAVKVNKELYDTIQTAIFSNLVASLSPLARLKMDFFLYKKDEKKAKESFEAIEKSGEKIRKPLSDDDDGAGSLYIPGFGYLSTYTGKDEVLEDERDEKKYYPIMKSIQKDIIGQAEEISKSTMQKKQIFDGKEFVVSKKIWGYSQKNKELMKSIIRENMNKDVTKCAKAIDALVKKGKSTACREYPNMMARLKGRIPGYVSFEAYRLARNEIAETTFRATLEDYVNNPFVEGAKWLLANNRLKKYEDECNCNDLAFQDAYGLGRGIYPLDKVPDRPHVMCLCTVAPVSSRMLKKALKDGMKVGNVPTKEWLESAREEKNANIIRDEENQFAFNLLQDEDDEVLKKSCIDAITSYNWFNEGIKDIDKNAFIEDLNKLTKEGLFVLARCTGGMNAELYYEGKEGSHYHPLKNKIYCNLSSDAHKADNKALGYKLGMKAFLHEAGHWIDSNITGQRFGLTLKMEKLYNSMQKDVLNVINKAGKELYKAKFTPLKKLSEASLDRLNPRIKQAVTSKISENIHINSNVSDMYGGLTRNQITGKIGNNKVYGHADEYWQYSNPMEYKFKVRAEFIAEAFESACNTRRVDAMKEYLPSAWKEFNSEMRKFIKGGNKK